ncbi:B- and T-lymphocyte attenuator-like isoform X2 [Rhinichthys klamathensis goyatoka]|uniref:B- and T-lymphocyte attenuator-like isoform X2 n=1 Tax=Rhinichthys klamathensis goyatoka TaxID=3034132 RepID=UPI0024B5FAC8|nr:B- and T-lymphocyte attenuator-like isoform X2 [Rhinichthys klamathensis goyatoka]
MIICNLAVSLLLLSLSVSGTTNRSELQCVQMIRVPRNTVFRACVMTELKINCTITQHGCHRSPQVSWCKIYGNHCKALNHSYYIETEWKNMTEHEGMAFLTFLNLSMEDAGLYRCKEGDNSVSHAINVTVTVNKEDEVPRNQSNTSDMNTTPDDDLQWLWPYVYICTGIAGLVFIVMAVTLLFIRCQGTNSRRKDLAYKNQYMETQRSDLPPPPPPHPHHNTCPPSDQPTSALYRVCETPPVRGASPAGRAVGIERGEEENALVYASLKHQGMSRGPKRTARQEPEPSEYAAIRFR